MIYIDKKLIGLDKNWAACLNKSMKFKLMLSKLGFGSKSVRKSPITMERERFEAEVKDQFKKLKDKGLSIPVFTL